MSFPPSAPYAALGEDPQEGDPIIVAAGEQYGWTGTITYVDQFFVYCRMNRLNGSLANGGAPIPHRLEYVRKVVPVPAFASEAEATEWTTRHYGEVAYQPTQRVRFSFPVRGRGRLTMTGQVIVFRPDCLFTSIPSPGYELLTVEHPDDPGEPMILQVPPEDILEEA